MICEKCGKEFDEDWRKDRYNNKKIPCRFCSRTCSNSRIQTSEMNERRRKKQQKREIKYCKTCNKRLSYNNKKGFCWDCKPRIKVKTRKELQDKQNKKKADIKKGLIFYKGGCCSVCGYNKNISALEFHHLDPKEKDFNISGGSFKYKDFSFLKEEVDKCILVCSNCHREIHHDNSIYIL